MTAPLASVRQAIADVYDGVLGLHAYAIVPPSPRSPFAIVGWPRIEYGDHGPQGDTWRLPVQFGTATGSSTAQQAELERLIARAVIKRVELDQTLNGTANGVWIEDVTVGYDVDTGQLTAIATLRIHVTEVAR